MSQLLFWRLWQCAGASPGAAVGAGVIGDIYKREERGTGMGWFQAVSCISVLPIAAAENISYREA
jgi:MFS family permease